MVGCSGGLPSRRSSPRFLLRAGVAKLTTFRVLDYSIWVWGIRHPCSALLPPRLGVLRHRSQTAGVSTCDLLSSASVTPQRQGDAAMFAVQFAFREGLAEVEKCAVAKVWCRKLLSIVAEHVDIGAASPDFAVSRIGLPQRPLKRMRVDEDFRHFVTIDSVRSERARSGAQLLRGGRRRRFVERSEVGADGALRVQGSRHSASFREQGLGCQQRRRSPRGSTGGDRRLLGLLARLGQRLRRSMPGLWPFRVVVFDSAWSVLIPRNGLGVFRPVHSTIFDSA